MTIFFINFRRKKNTIKKNRIELMAMDAPPYKEMENHLLFLSSELSEANKRANLFHSAFVASENLWTATDKTLRTTHPNLAMKLRVVRCLEMPRKINCAKRTIGNIHQELTDLRREKRQLRLAIKNVQKTAENFLDSSSRSSSRNQAAEITKLKAEIALLKSKQK